MIHHPKEVENASWNVNCSISRSSMKNCTRPPKTWIASISTIYVPHLTQIPQAFHFLGDTYKASYSCNDWMGSIMSGCRRSGGCCWGVRFSWIDMLGTFCIAEVTIQLGIIVFGWCDLCSCHEPYTLIILAAAAIVVSRCASVLLLVRIVPHDLVVVALPCKNDYWIFPFCHFQLPLPISNTQHTCNSNMHCCKVGCLWVGVIVFANVLVTWWQRR